MIESTQPCEGFVITPRRLVPYSWRSRGGRAIQFCRSGLGVSGGGVT